MKSKLKILFLSQYFYPEQFLNNSVATDLVRSGHIVNVVCCVPNYPAGRFFDGFSNSQRRSENWNGIEIHRVLTIPRGKSAVQLLANYLTYPLAAAWKIVNLGRDRGDVSFVSMPSPLFQAFAGIFAKKVFGIPTVYWIQDIWPDSALLTLNIKNKALTRILEWLCGWIYRQADFLLVQSDGFIDTISKYGVDPGRIATLPNTAPPHFRPVEKADVRPDISRLLPSDRSIIMFAGNIGESQDFDTVIDAAMLLPPESNVLIVVVGSGRDEERVRHRISTMGLDKRFLFVGRHPEEDMPQFFSFADAMLVTLKSFPIFALTVPSKVQAYMACSKPIIASLNGEGARLIEQAGAGFTVPASNADALSRLFVQIEEIDQSELQAIGKAGHRYFQTEFSPSILLNNLLTFLNRAADKN